MVMCSNCHKRVAVIFVTKVEKGEKSSNGLCIKCAKQMGLPIENMLGDIVVSLEKAQAQAEEYGHSFEREVAFLCVHSTLHLLGYDHETSEEDELDMRRRQTEIVEMLGLAVK